MAQSNSYSTTTVHSMCTGSEATKYFPDEDGWSLRHQDGIGLEFTWSSGSATPGLEPSGSLRIQTSNRQTVWTDIGACPSNISGSVVGSSRVFQTYDLQDGYIRAVYTHSTGTGSLVCSTFVKGAV